MFRKKKIKKVDEKLTKLIIQVGVEQLIESGALKQIGCEKCNNYTKLEIRGKIIYCKLCQKMID